MPNYLPPSRYALGFLNSFEGERYSYKYAELPILTSSQIGFTIYCEDYWTIAGVGTTAIGFGFTGELLSWDGSNWIPAVYNYNVQVFSTAGTFTWTRPNRMTEYSAWLLGGGGSGGSGRKGAAGVIRTGGSAGSASGIHNITGPAVNGVFPGTTETVVVAASVAGGAAQTANSTNGNPGLAGNSSQWGWFKVPGGNPGSGGTSTTAAIASGMFGSPRDTYNSGASTAGGVGSATSTIGSVPVSVSSTCAPSTGGSGGGISAANFGQYGGSSGRVGNAFSTTIPGFVTPFPVANTPSGYSINGVNGSNGPNLVFPFFSGTGGSGGGSADPANTASNGGNGGNGGNWGASGGGGGACTDGTGISGAGGSGAIGLVIVYSRY